MEEGNTAKHPSYCHMPQPCTGSTNRYWHCTHSNHSLVTHEVQIDCSLKVVIERCIRHSVNELVWCQNLVREDGILQAQQQVCASQYFYMLV